MKYNLKKFIFPLAVGLLCALYCMLFYTLRVEEINGAPVPGAVSAVKALSFFMALVASAFLRVAGLINISYFLNNLLVFIFNFLVYGSAAFCIQELVCLYKRRCSAGEKLITKIEKCVFSAAAVCLLIICAILRTDAGNYEVKRFDVAVKDLPAELEGVRFVLAADLHLGWYSRDVYIKRAAELINNENPDIIIAAGDFVFREGERSFRRASEWLKLLKPKTALLGVLGNHDNWQGHEMAVTILPEGGIRFLDNSRVFLTRDKALTDEVPEAGLCIAGVGDEWTDTVDFDSALSGVKEDFPRIVISHIPDVAFDNPVSHRIDLMLCGHTHGGQIVLPYLGPVGMSTNYGDKLLNGWGKDTPYPVYINVGLGETVLPFRYGVRPEITVFTLHQDKGLSSDKIK